MQPWIEAALPRSSDVERRGSARPVETVFDQLATDAVAAGQTATMIVMTMDSATVSPGLLPSWVARIRARLRAGDRAGMLSDREIAGAVVRRVGRPGDARELATGADAGISRRHSGLRSTRDRRDDTRARFALRRVSRRRCARVRDRPLLTSSIVFLPHTITDASPPRSIRAQ